MKRIKKEESGNHIRMDRCQTEKKSRVQRRRRGRGIYALLKKDCRMMLDGKFFFIALGSLVLYTLFIRFGYLKFMNMEIYNIYLYDPAGTQTAVSSAVHPVSSREDMDGLLAKDANGVGICVDDGVPHIVLYAGSEKIDRHRADYALSLLHSGGALRETMPETVGEDSPEMKKRREITCELLFVEIIAVGFLGIASVLFKEKQMGVIRVHAIMPFWKSLFVLSKVFLFLVADLLFALLLVILNIGFAEAGRIMPAVSVYTAILSVIMALSGFYCAMLLKDFKQFSLAYLVIALFAATPVFLSANTSVKMAWIGFHPFYPVYMGLKNAFFAMPAGGSAYYICAACAVALLFIIALAAFRREMGREG